MNQSKGCGCVRNDETYTWYLVQTLKSASPTYCKTPATSFDFAWSIDQPGRNKKP